MKLMDRDRAEALAAFFLEKAPGRRLNDLKLMKLMYISERESLRTLFSTLTNDEFVSMPKGPVLSGTYNLLRGQGGVAFPSIIYIPKSSGKVSTNTFELVGTAHPEEQFSEAELELLDSVWAKYKAARGYALAEMTHEEFSEWDPAAREQMTSIPLPIEDIYTKGLGVDERKARQLAGEIRYFASIAQ